MACRKISSNRLVLSNRRTVVTGLVAASIAAPVSADFVYNLDAVGTTTGDFVLTVPSLISVNTTFQLTDFDSITRR
jgi:hypothetical protein